MTEQVKFHDIAFEARRLASKHGMFFALVGFGISAGYSALDLLGATSSSVVAGLVVTVYLQYGVTERLLADHIQPDRSGKRRYWSLFGSGVLSGLGILAGTLLLILPGIYLAGRWLSTSAYVVVEGKSSFEAVSAAWEQSAPSPTAHVGAAAASIIPMGLFITMLMLGIFADLTIDGSLEIVVINVLTAASSLLVWLFGAAAYGATHKLRGELDHVFA